MLFNSIQFVLFFPLVVWLYFLLPLRARNLFLLLASYYFYMCWEPTYIILILLSTGVDYAAGLRMAATDNPRRRKAFLLLSLVSNLGLLFVFKYVNFFNDNLRALFEQFNLLYDVPAFKLLLPVGISFYTFQTLSYTIDVYRGKQQAERDPLKFALYVAFFPQLVAGPIERSTHLLAQFHRNIAFDATRVAEGLERMLWGFFKKLVIADRLAVYVNEVYQNPGAHEGGPLWLATWFFAFQIYCDFSAYSDIAIGAARVLGIDLRENFRRPYLASSIGEFWKRWHISLSTWFRDYLYIPLGGNRGSAWRWQMNIMIVFLLSALWHGAQWTFVMWGVLHGFYFLAAAWLRPLTDGCVRVFRLTRFRQAIGVFVTVHLVLLAWVFFRANSLDDAWVLLKGMFSLSNWSLSALTGVALGRAELIVAIGSILLMEVIQLLQGDRPLHELLRNRPRWFRWGVYHALIFAIFFLGKTGRQEFIYFQF
ncbi:MAG: MBOAT family O-acyltransferase [Verrucomicrobiota bacterium]